MNTHVLFFLFSLILLASQALASPSYRAEYEFDANLKWDCFYRSTVPVEGLDPAVWRHDEYGNLLMASLNHGCKGCLCYSFDHRYPISAVLPHNPKKSVIAEIKSIANCQALSYRTNALKGSKMESQIANVIGSFGCDAQTMTHFTKNKFSGAKAVQAKLMDERRLQTIRENYQRYLEGPNFINRKMNPSLKDTKNYFKHLRSISTILIARIQGLIAKK